MHEPAPESEYWPAGQLEHELPVDMEPAGQVEQEEAPGLPYWPDGQVVQLAEPDGATEPEEHGMQIV